MKFKDELFQILNKEAYSLLNNMSCVSEDALNEWRETPYFHLLKEVVEGKISGLSLKLALDGIKSNEEKSG